MVPANGWIEKHGTTKRRSWHKLHISLDAVSGEIVASTLTGRDIDDGSHVATLNEAARSKWAFAS